MQEEQSIHFNTRLDKNAFFTILKKKSIHLEELCAASWWLRACGQEVLGSQEFASIKQEWVKKVVKFTELEKIQPDKLFLVGEVDASARTDHSMVGRRSATMESKSLAQVIRSFDPGCWDVAVGKGLMPLSFWSQRISERSEVANKMNQNIPHHSLSDMDKMFYELLAGFIFIKEEKIIAYLKPRLMRCLECLSEHPSLNSALDVASDKILDDLKSYSKTHYHQMSKEALEGLKWAIKEFKLEERCSKGQGSDFAPLLEHFEKMQEALSLLIAWRPVINSAYQSRNNEAIVCLIDGLIRINPKTILVWDREDKGSLLFQSLVLKNKAITQALLARGAVGTGTVAEGFNHLTEMGFLVGSRLNACAIFWGNEAQALASHSQEEVHILCQLTAIHAKELQELGVPKEQVMDHLEKAWLQNNEGYLRQTEEHKSQREQRILMLHTVYSDYVNHQEQLKIMTLKATQEGTAQDPEVSSISGRKKKERRSL